MLKSLKSLIILLILALLLRLLLFSYGTYRNDLVAFELWSLDLIRYGFSNFYTVAKSDYPPGFLYILWLTGKVYYWSAAHLNFSPADLFFKLPSIIADIGSGFFIYLILRKITSFKKSILGASLFLFNPFVIANSTLWGQIDGLLTFFLIASLFFLISNKFILAAFLLGFGYLIKPIAILCLPIFLIYIIKQKQPAKNTIRFLAVFLLIIILLFLPFNNQTNFLTFLIERHINATTWFPYATLNAFNFWASISILDYGTIEKVSDQSKLLIFSYKNWGYLIFGSIYLFLLTKLFKKLKKEKEQILPLLIILTLTFIAMFLFLTQIRERHLFYGLSFLTILIPFLPKKQILVILPFYIIYLFNLYFSFVLPSENPIALPTWTIILFSLVNIGVFLYILKKLFLMKRV